MIPTNADITGKTKARENTQDERIQERINGRITTRVSKLTAERDHEKEAEIANLRKLPMGGKGREESTARNSGRAYGRVAVKTVGGDEPVQCNDLRCEMG